VKEEVEVRNNLEVSAHAAHDGKIFQGIKSEGKSGLRWRVKYPWRNYTKGGRGTDRRREGLKGQRYGRERGTTGNSGKSRASRRLCYRREDVSGGPLGEAVGKL